MKSKKMMAMLLTASLVITTALTGCGNKTANANAPGEDNQNKQEEKQKEKEEEKVKKEPILNLTQGACKTLDTSLGTDEVSFCAVQNSFEGLTRFNYAENKTTPGIAESWEASDDGLTWTFHLRDAKWTDGKPVTAQDFVYSWMRLITPETKASYSFFLTDAVPIKNAAEYYAKKAKKEDVGIKAVDDKTLQVKLAKPTPYFLGTTSFAALCPLRKDIVEAQGKKYGTDASKLVYNGPFKITNWRKGSKMVFEKNKDYWDTDNIKLDKVNLLVIDEIATRYQMFMNGDLDAMAGSRDYLAKLKASADKGEVQYIQGVRPSTFYFLFNFKKNPVFKSVKVRQALSSAIDRETYTEKILKRMKPAYSLIPPSLVCMDKEYRNEVPEQLKEMKDDPKELFKEGLKELGMDEDPSKVTIHYLSQGNDANERADAEYFQNQWQTKIGCKVVIDASADFSDFLAKEDNGDFEMGFNGWGADYNDPYTFLGLFLKNNGNNTGKYYNAKLEKICKKLSSEADPQKRLELCKEAENILVKDDPALIPIYYTDRKSFLKNYVKGIQYPLFGGTYDFKWASVEN